jgi:hypothetical protein
MSRHENMTGLTISVTDNYHHHHHHHHHHISVMELSHLLTRSGLTYREVSSKVCHNSFCELENSVSLPWVIYYEAFYLHAVRQLSLYLIRHTTAYGVNTVSLTTLTGV